MTRRTKICSLSTVVICLVAALLCWPRTNWAARRTLDELRSLIEVQVATAEDATIDEKSKLQVEIDMRIAQLCLSDITEGLFGTAGGPANVIRGRVHDGPRAGQLLRRLEAMGVLFELDEPRVVTVTGRHAGVYGGFELPAKTANGAAVEHYHVGWRVSLLPQVTVEGNLLPELEAELTCLAEETPTAAVPLAAPPKRHKMSSGKFVTRFRPGDTLIVAGLTQRGKRPKRFKAPLLSDLPAVGGWFTWTQPRDVEEELIVLMTPRLVRENEQDHDAGGPERRPPRLRPPLK